jgi:hypothetical protein
MSITDGVPGPRGVRLTFSYDAEGVRLHSSNPVNKQPRADEDPLPAPGSGAVVAEVRTSGGHVTYRTVVPRAMPATIEVVGGPRGFELVPNVSNAGAFTVTVPLDAPGSEVVLLGRPSETALRAREASGRGAGEDLVELGRFPLAKAR